MSFRTDLNRFDRRLNIRMRRFVIDFATGLTRELGLATPFDTGRAAGSWTAAVGGADTRVLPPEVRFSSREQAVQFQRIDLGNFILGDSVHLANSLPYIRKLNAGSSAQAPSNFVEMTLQTAGRRVAGRAADRR